MTMLQSQPVVPVVASATSDYYHQYVAVAAFTIAAVLMVAAMLGAGRLLRPNRPQAQKYVAYEAGSDPVSGFGQANVRYYIYGLLFVIFDVEAVFIFPWATNLDDRSVMVGGSKVVMEGLGVFGLVEMVVFIVILSIGLLYAWRKGVLRWA